MASSSSSSSSPSSSSPAAVCTLANLSPIYGSDRARQVIKYALEDFAPYADNFTTHGPMRAQIQRGQSQGLMLSIQHRVQCNSGAVTNQGNSSSNSNTTPARVWIGIFFPPAFPARAPQVALLLSPSQAIRPNHAIVAPNGAVRLDRLECGANPASLLDILMAMIIVLDNDNPVLDRGGVAPQPQNGTNINCGVGLNNANAGSNSNNGGQYQQQQQQAVMPANDPSSSIQLTPEQTRLHDAFVSDIFQLQDKYLSVRMETLAHAEVLKEVETSLQREAAALREEIDLLRIANQEQQSLQSAIDAYRASAAAHNNANNNPTTATTGSNSTNSPAAAGIGNNFLGATTSSLNGGGSSSPYTATPTPMRTDLENITALDCVEPANELHAQALDLLATVNAYEDQLDFMEKCLARRAISFDEYLRYVNAIARDEFHSRYMYQRASDKLQQDRSAQTLQRKYGQRGIDQQVIKSVLAANAYNLGKADKALADMVA